MRKILFILGFLLMGGNAQAGMSGAHLLEYCGSSDVTFKGLCLGYITGYLDLNSLIQDPRVYPWEEGDKNKIPKTCLPTHVTVGQIRTGLLAYPLRFRPELRDQLLKFNGGILLSRSIRAAWPCEKNN